MFGIDIWYLILVLPAIILSLIAQARVSSAFRKFSKVPSSRGLTGAEAARLILTNSGINDVAVEQIAGSLTDHYDPRTKVLRLSEDVYSSDSLAAVGVAAHETGHAIQHSAGYVPLAVRSGIFPVVNIGSKIAVPLIFIGFLLGSGTGAFGAYMIQAGILLFAAVVVFQIVTLPVEFNASARATAILEESGILDAGEVYGAKKVLNAAAMTYVAAAITSIMQLLRFILLANRRR